MAIKNSVGSNKNLVVCLVLIMLFLLVVQLFFFANGKRIIESAYNGESSAFLNEMIEGQSVHSLDFYYGKARDLLLIFNGVIALVFLVLLSARTASRKRSKYIIFAIVSLAILAYSLWIVPKRTGDGREYILMTESFFNHGSPDLRDGDMAAYKRLREIYKFEDYIKKNYNYARVFFKAENGRLYSYHFWMYSLICLPAKAVLHYVPLNEVKAFQLTNALLLILALFHIVFKLQMNDVQKVLFLFLMIFSPAFWFVRWTHPEIFSFSFVTIALVFMNRKKWPLAILFAAVASIQNQPIVILVAFFWLKALIESKSKIKDFFVLSISGMPALIPFIFYFVNFGTFSLLKTVATDPSNMSIFLVLEMFFDANLGMFPYIPVVLAVFFIIIFRDIFIQKKFTLSVQFLLILILMMLLCTLTVDWNHGTVGPTRYIIWMLPLILYVVVSQPFLDNKSGANSLIYLRVVWVSIVIQVFILFLYIPRTMHTAHTPLAKTILNYFPKFYNPTPEIFIERSEQKSDIDSQPIIYYYNDHCRKALVKVRNAQKLEEICGHSEKLKHYMEKYKNDRNRLVYVDY